jgi:hypothetical protein
MFCPAPPSLVGDIIIFVLAMLFLASTLAIILFKKKPRAEKNVYEDLTPLTKEQAIAEAKYTPNTTTHGKCRNLDLTLLCIIGYAPYVKGKTYDADLVDPEVNVDSIHIDGFGWAPPWIFHILE